MENGGRNRRSGWLWFWLVAFLVAVLMLLLWAWPARQPADTGHTPPDVVHAVALS